MVPYTLKARLVTSFIMPGQTTSEDRKREYPHFKDENIWRVSFCPPLGTADKYALLGTIEKI